MNLFGAKPIISQPQAAKGAVMITIFLLPSQPDKNPPMGEQIIPTIQKSEANNDPSLSSSLTLMSVSSFHWGIAIVANPTQVLPNISAKVITNAPQNYNERLSKFF